MLSLGTSALKGREHVSLRLHAALCIACHVAMAWVCLT